jgi:hypothetical protein
LFLARLPDQSQQDLSKIGDDDELLPFFQAAAIYDAYGKVSDPEIRPNEQRWKVLDKKLTKFAQSFGNNTLQGGRKFSLMQAILQDENHQPADGTIFDARVYAELINIFATKPVHTGDVIWDD